MAYTIAQAKTDLQGILRGTSLSKVQGPNELMARAGRDLLLDVDPQETRRITRVAATFYDKVYSHPVPADLKGNKIIDIRPISDRQFSDVSDQTYTRAFDVNKTSDSVHFTIQHNSGTKFISIDANVSEPGILIEECDSLTETATWSGSSQIFNLAVDTVFKVVSTAAIRFDILGSGGVAGFPLLFGSSVAGGTATLTANLVNPVDLSTHENIGSIFLYLYVDNISALNSVTLQWGSSSTDYWSQTVTAGHYEPFRNGWNLLRFDWFGATSANTPNSSAIDFLQLSFDTSADLYNLRVDSIYSKIPKYYEIVYYSKYLFSSSTNIWKETVDDDSDLVNLDTESYNLFLYKVAELAAINTQTGIIVRGRPINPDQVTFTAQYQNALATYKNMYKSEVSQPRQDYYKVPRNRRFLR